MKIQTRRFRHRDQLGSHQLEVRIDWKRLAQYVASRAQRNIRKTVSLLNGSIFVRIISSTP
jgi:hypothetical protein